MTDTYKLTDEDILDFRIRMEKAADDRGVAVADLAINMRKKVENVVFSLHCLESGLYTNGDPIKAGMVPSFVSHVISDLKS